jgi:hypothetical protein
LKSSACNYASVLQVEEGPALVRFCDEPIIVGVTSSSAAVPAQAPKIQLTTTTLRDTLDWWRARLPVLSRPPRGASEGQNLHPDVNLFVNPDDVFWAESPRVHKCPPASSVVLRYPSSLPNMLSSHCGLPDWLSLKGHFVQVFSLNR